MRIRTLTAIGLVLSALVGHGSNTAYLRGVQSMETTGIPLTVVDTSPDPTAGKVTFTLRNDSDKVVTAWHVR